MGKEWKAWQVLTMNTLAFTICFSCWMMNGVLVTFLVNHEVFQWDNTQIGWLIGIPVLTGSLVRLPLGILTDKYGGRIVYCVLMLLSALAMLFISTANNFFEFLVGSLGFGITGGSFAIGIAYTSIWFKREHQGTALGIFGAGNAGAALTSMGAPYLLNYLTNQGTTLDRWRLLPIIYAISLVVMTIIFYLFTFPRKAKASAEKTFKQRLEPLKHPRVHRFGLYYFFVFGGFVALAQWLIPYYVNTYQLSILMAGWMAAIFSLPSGIIRAMGGWLSDLFGARKVMYWVFGTCIVACLLLTIPQVDIYTPGKGIQARNDGEVTSVSATKIIVSQNGKEKVYSLVTKPDKVDPSKELIVWPKRDYWQEPIVSVDDPVVKKQLIGRGITHIFFQANIWVFTGLVFIVGIMMGIGKAAVFKHIPEYFPDDVGVVGGIVGVIGGLGGFILPIIFGYLLQMTGIWTTCWILLSIIASVCLWWMHQVIQKMMREEVPDLMRRMDK